MDLEKQRKDSADKELKSLVAKHKAKAERKEEEQKQKE